MEIRSGYERLLANNGLGDFDSFMSYTGGTVLKKITVRSITRIELDDGDEKRGFYLKRHCRKLKAGERLKAALKGSIKGEARAEWEAAAALEEAGIGAVVAVAFGERNNAASKEESFLLTEALDDFTQLEAMVDELGPPLTWDEVLRKRALIEAVGRLVRDFHEKGFNHRDLYLTHVMARPDERSDTGFEIRLIDLQRVQRREEPGERWLVKDITALNYSSPAGAFTRSDRMRFYRAYTGRKLTKEDKTFIGKVLKKTARVAGHTVKMYAKRAERKSRGLLER